MNKYTETLHLCAHPCEYTEGGLRYKVFTHCPTEGSDYVCVAEHEISLDIPEHSACVTAMIGRLESQIEDVNAQAHIKKTAISETIQSLLAIEHQAVA